MNKSNDFPDFNDDAISVCDNMSEYSDEGQYSILRNEVRSTWPKRRPTHGYQNPKETFTRESQMTILNTHDSRCHSPLNGSVSDIIYKDVDENISSIQDNIEEIVKKMDLAKEEKLEKTNQYHRNLEENKNLLKKIQYLEVQIMVKEKQCRERYEQTKKNLQAEFKKLKMQKNEEIEKERNRVTKLEQGLSSQRISRVARKNEVENTQYEIQRLHDKIRQTSNQLTISKDELIRLKEISKREIKIEKKERDAAQKKFFEYQENLTEAYESSLDSIKVSNQLEDLLRLSQKLQHENRKLTDDLEEAQAEILARSVVEGKSLLQEHKLSPKHKEGSINLSWAAETDNHTKAELIEFIIRETEANKKLRQYSDKMISRIIEVNPSILEV